MTTMSSEPPLRILLGKNQTLQSDVMAFWLRPQGHEVIQANIVKDIIGTLRSSLFDLLIVDGALVSDELMKEATGTTTMIHTAEPHKYSHLTALDGVTMLSKFLGVDETCAEISTMIRSIQALKKAPIAPEVTVPDGVVIAGHSIKGSELKDQAKLLSDINSHRVSVPAMQVDGKDIVLVKVGSKDQIFRYGHRMLDSIIEAIRTKGSAEVDVPALTSWVFANALNGPSFFDLGKFWREVVESSLIDELRTEGIEAFVTTELIDTTIKVQGSGSVVLPDVKIAVTSY